MAIASVSETDLAAIAKAYSEKLIASGKNSVEFSDWPNILGDALFTRAFEGGYFGPKGTIAGFPPGKYADLKVKGVQVTTETGTGGTNWAVLYVDGVEVARENAGSDGKFDTVAFAARHGQQI
jgi:hypothetical protein